VTEVSPADPMHLWLASVAIAASLAVVGALVWRSLRGLPLVARRPHPAACWDGGDVAAIAALYALLAITASTLISKDASIGELIVVDMVSKLAVVALGIAHLAVRGAGREAIGFPPPSLADLRLAFATLALVVAPLLGVAGILDRIVPYQHPVVDYLRGHRDPLAIGLVVLSAVVVAPLAEEFFFRRVLQGWLERRLGPHRGGTAVFIAAAAFAVAHTGQGLAWVPLLLFGLVLGTLARETGSLVPCILLHGLFNAVSIALLLTGAVPPPIPAG
jgi:membrane protease YdiL (CAAX protease family)